MPFLWVAPLALYLLTFVLVFAPRTIVPLRWMVRGQPLLIVATAATLLCSGGGAGMKEFLLFGSLHLATFFVTAMVCHGQLAADRPAPSQLTEFYLWMSLGGVAGGLLTALVAPLVFKSVLEYPLMMAAACLLRPRPVFSGGVGRKDTLPIAALLFCLVAAWGLRTGSFLSGLRYTDSPGVRVALVALAAFATFLLRRRPVVFGTAVALLAATSLWSVETGYRLLDAQRGFLGILRVEYDPLWNMNQLLNGTTSHGQQSRFESQRREPQGYFHRRGPLGAIFNRLKPRRPLAEVGVLGLGVGTIAAYAEPGERFTFYEINPAVEQIARNTDYFTYLADCRGEVEVIPGDARLSLESEQERQFDLLIVDVYSSDSVPIHLTTHEAMQIYFKHLKPGGLLAIHISSRYFDLAPFLGNLAAEDGRTARIWRDLGLMEVVGKFPSVWVVMARSADDLGPLADAPWTPLKRDAGPLWTDDFSNVAAALRQEPWNSTGLRLKPMKWANQADGHAVLAGYLRTEGRTDEAIEHLRRALEIEPDNAENHLTLGTILVSLGRSDEALGHLQQAVNSNPDDKGAHSELGIALYRTGKTDEALAHFRQALAIDPGYVEGLRNLAKALVDGRQFDEAVECFRKAITIQPGNAEIRFDLGLALIRQGNISAAKEELRQALSLTDGKDAALVEKIKAEIRRCDAWPWEEETK
jgi:Flp pilus assembly protein TadD/SAM-dependent methyltransferase